MGEIEIWFASHAQLVLYAGIAGTLVGIALWLAGRAFSKPRVQITATKGGVVVNGNNNGFINTGNIGAATQAPDLLTTLAGWATVIGLPISIASLLISVLAWRLPLAS